MTEWTLDNDRRKTFRIDETGSVEVIDVTDRGGAGKSPISYFASSPTFTLAAQLQLIEDDLQSLISRADHKDTFSLELAAVLNRKLNLLATVIHQQETQGAINHLSLSEGGLSFIHDQPIAPKQLLALKVRLESDHLGFYAFAQVVYSLAIKQHHYRIGCEFLQLDETTQQLLNRHILEFQARQRRQEREKQNQ